MQGTNIHFRMNNFVQPKRALYNKPVLGGIVNPSITHTHNISSREPVGPVVNLDTTITYPQNNSNKPNINVDKNIESTSRIIVNDEYDTPQPSDSSSDELSQPDHSSKLKCNNIYDSDDDDDNMKPDFEDDEEDNDHEISHTYNKTNNNRRELYK